MSKERVLMESREVLSTSALLRGSVAFLIGLGMKNDDTIEKKDHSQRVLPSQRRA